ncbi:MAG: lipoyl(octanoyl) transferase LipB [Dehalococcoidia bacterium]|jgi:lipoate-protein ligase B|nr:lipoyl(octanoyl) transferase LipB [Dehalococcoidia bacterium]
MTVATFKKGCIATYLGMVPYEVALKLQQRLVQARAEGKISDLILLLEHPSVFTVGRFRGAEDINVPPETLAREGIAVFHTDRGGGITYHGPGQLVGYPIVNLKENGLGVREYIWKLEAAIIKTLLALGIQGYRLAGYPGVWANGKKVCSIGIHVSHHITTHGFALNVTTDLRYFGYTRPCGLTGEVMTSISELAGHTVETRDIIETFLPSFSETFGLSCEQETDRWLATLDARSG